MNGRVVALAAVALLCAVAAFSAPPEASGTIKIGKMYWTDEGTGKIQRADLDGDFVEDLVIGLTEPSDVALDTVNGKMYWTERSPGRIQRANIEIPPSETPSTRTDVETCYAGLTKPVGIALDVAGGKVYWTQTGPDTDRIRRANLDCSGTLENLADLGNNTAVYRMALDVSGGYVYWGDARTPGGDRIQRCNLKPGCTVETIVEGLSDPFGIALDLTRAKVYWGDTGSHKIQRANLDGSSPEDVVTGVDPFGLAVNVTGQIVYWTEPGNVQRCYWKQACNPQTLVTGLTGPVGIALDVQGVGGIAELPDGDAARLEAGGSSGLSAGVLAGIAAAAAAGVVAVGGAAWYARRRLIK